MTLRIGIDARRYGPVGRGQERYVRCLVHALAAADGGHELVLLANGSRPSGDLGGRTRVVSASRRLRLQHRSHFGMARRLLVRDLDLVHFPLADGWYARVGRAIVTIHDLGVLRYPEAYFADAAAERTARRHFAAITASADAVIAVSETTRQDVVELLGVPPERVAVIPHGVTSRFGPAGDASVLESARRRYALDGPYLLFLGGIDFKKNVAGLIAGYALARRRGSLPHRLVLAGELQQTGNPHFDVARKQAEACGVEAQLAWLGRVPDEDLPALYAAADALVYPSIWEGFGLPVLEAMACGTPVVTSAGTAMAEVVGEAGVLVDPSDPDSLGDGILEALDPEAGRRLAQAGPPRAAAYTWERAAERTLAVYEAVGADRQLPVEAGR